MLDGCSPAALTLDATNKCGFKIFFCAPLPCFSSIIRCPSVRFPVAYFHQKAFHQNNFSNVEPSILRRWLIIQAKNLFRPTLQETKRSRRLIAETQKANTALTSSFRHLYLKPKSNKSESYLAEPALLAWLTVRDGWTHPLDVALDHLGVSSLVTCHTHICLQTLPSPPQLAFLWTGGWDIFLNKYSAESINHMSLLLFDSALVNQKMWNGLVRWWHYPGLFPLGSFPVHYHQSTSITP